MGLRGRVIVSYRSRCPRDKPPEQEELEQIPKPSGPSQHCTSFRAVGTSRSEIPEQLQRQRGVLFGDRDVARVAGVDLHAGESDLSRILVGTKDRVDPGLITRPARLEPVQYIRIDAQRHQRFGSCDVQAAPDDALCNVPQIGRRVSGGHANVLVRHAARAAIRL